jgi:hypothetical protein
MSSSPRFTRGTSVIAALVFAAILGAVALSLNALQSGSANTAALPAQAAAPAAGAVSQSDATCQDGEDFNYTVGSQTILTGGATLLGGANTQTIQGIEAPQMVPTCPSDQDALTQVETNPKYGAARNPDGTWRDLPGTVNLTPTPPPTRNALQCNNGKLQPEQQNSSLCKYILQKNGTSYKLQSWMCRVSFYNANPNAPTGDTCWVKQVPVQGSTNSGAVNSVPPGSPGSGEVSSGSGTQTNSGAVVSADSGLTTSSSGACAGNNNCSNGQVCNMQTYQCVNPNTTGATNQSYQGPCPGGQAVDPLTGQCSSSNTNGQNQTWYCVTSVNPIVVTQQQAASNPNPSMCSSQPPTNNNQTTTGGAGTVGAGSGAGTTNTSGAGNNNSGLGALGSFLTGLTKGLLTPCASQSTSIGGNGTTLVPVQVYNPTTGTYSTSYVQQSTGGTTGQPCAQQQQAPYGVGSNGAICNAPPAVPQCAAGATAQPTSSQGNGCVDGYQCVPTSSTFGQTPTPQISCSPQTADVGQSVAISYSCENATGSSGAGFSTNNQQSGSATSTIATPPSGTNTANFGLTCTNNGQTASAQCSVQINQPAIDLVADPQYVQSGATASIGWVTAGMQSCVISSPTDLNFTEENAGNQSANGVAQTDAITANTEFDLTCQTLGGQTKTASTIVSIGSATSTSATSTSSGITVSSTADGQTVNHGSAVTIHWNESTASANSDIALWLIDLQSEQAVAYIATGEPLSGSYQWTIPAVGSTCNASLYLACASDLVAGDSYAIEAALYTPQNAYFDAPPVPSGLVSPTYTDYGYTTNPFTIGQ